MNILIQTATGFQEVDTSALSMLPENPLKTEWAAAVSTDQKLTAIAKALNLV